MPTYNAASADKSVVAQAYAAAIKLTSDPKILLALFEAGMVESNFHNNLTATDHDSLGYLQQRPSQGWKNPTDIPTATKAFIDKAIAKLKANPALTAGQLAQAVQVSAYPERYDQAQGAAQQLLNTASGGRLSVIDTIGLGADTVLDKVGAAIKEAGAPLVSVGKLADWIFKLSLPSNALRVGAGVLGVAFLVIGIHLLTKEVRHA